MKTHWLKAVFVGHCVENILSMAFSMIVHCLSQAFIEVFVALVKWHVRPGKKELIKLVPGLACCIETVFALHSSQGSNCSGC